MRKSVLMVAAAASVFALTAGGAAVFTTTGTSSVTLDSRATVTVASDVCEGPITVGYTFGSGEDSNKITAVTLETADNCTSDTVEVTLANLAENPTYSRIYAGTFNTFGSEKTTATLSLKDTDPVQASDYDVSTNKLATATVVIKPA